MSKKQKQRKTKTVDELTTVMREEWTKAKAYKPRPISQPQIPSITLTLSGDEFIATDHTNHSIRIPATENGLRVLKQLLRAKQLSPQKQFASIAQPTQQMVENFLRNRKLEEENEQASILKEF